MADEQKSIALVILGIVAVIAVVGLVLLFVQGKSATGEGVYGGAIKQVEFPYWVGRGTPRNIPGDLSQSNWPMTASKDLTSHWNWEGDPKRNPIGDVPSVLTKCGNGGFLVPYNLDRAGYYANLGYEVIDTDGSKAGMCVYPQEPMVGGIAGLQ